VDNGDPGNNLPTVLSWPYQALTAEAATAFRLLGLAFVPDIGLSAVASLIAVLAENLIRAGQALHTMTSTPPILRWVPRQDDWPCCDWPRGSRNYVHGFDLCTWHLWVSTAQGKRRCLVVLRPVLVENAAIWFDLGDRDIR
jgi:hypothetical protein